MNIIPVPLMVNGRLEFLSNYRNNPNISFYYLNNTPNLLTRLDLNLNFKYLGIYSNSNPNINDTNVSILENNTTDMINFLKFTNTVNNINSSFIVINNSPYLYYVLSPNVDQMDMEAGKKKSKKRRYKKRGSKRRR